MDDSAATENPFQAAFVAEMEPASEIKADVEEKAEEPISETNEKIETPEESANTEASAAADEGTKEEADEEPTFATKQDVLDAMREYNNEASTRLDTLETVKNEIIKTAYPDGIEQPIYDDMGNVIKTAQDIVDRGLIKQDGEPYTYEEAASFMLKASQQMAENVAELNKWADTVAEQNISLRDSNERVMADWGDVLKAMPTVAKQLADKYVSTQLEFDKSNSYITHMNMTPEDFYALTLAPYKQLGEAMAEKEALQTSTQSEDAIAEQNERMGLPPQRGQAVVNSNTGDAMLDALIDEMNKG